MILVERSLARTIQSNATAVCVLAGLILTATVALAALVSYSQSGVSAANVVPKRATNISFLNALLNYRSQFVNVTNRTQVSWLLSHSVDLRVQPCENFYAYACGRYRGINATPLVELVARNVSVSVRDDFLKVKASPDGGSAKGKAAAFFASCVSSTEGAHKEESVKTLVRFMKQNGLRFGTDKAGGFDFLGELFRFLLDYNLQLFFGLSVDPWPQRGKLVRFIHIVASEDFEAWRKTRDRYVHEKKYDELVKQVLSATDAALDNHVASLALQVMAIEGTIMKMWKNRNADSGSSKGPLARKWESSLQLHSKGAFVEGYELDLKSDVAAFLNAVLMELNPTEHAIYLSWLVAGHLVSVSGIVTADHRERDLCFRKTYALFKHAVVAPYLFRVVNKTILTKVRQMVESIDEEVQMSINNSSWLSPDIKTVLGEKIAAVKWKLGYNLGLDNWGGVDRFYSGYPVPRGIYLETYLATSQAYAAQQLALRPYWSADFANANFESDVPSVFYNGPNTISIAAATMVPPFFDVRERAALNYGVLGSVVTGQLMRAFHHENRKDDGKGSRIAWSGWEERNFMDRWNCRQNSRPGLPYDDIEPAVSIGAHALFNAYKGAAAKELKQAADGLSSDQLFFVSRCLVYCGYMHIDTPHECGVMAQDSREFSRAFNCSRGSPMNPENKCDLW